MVTNDIVSLCRLKFISFGSNAFGFKKNDDSHDNRKDILIQIINKLDSNK